MKEIDLISSLHKKTKRDYLARVNNLKFPKHKAASLAKKFDYDYWDGDRQICYGGYRYIEGRWNSVIRAMIKNYGLPSNPKILDVGCGKGFLLYDFLKICPDAELYGLDISDYAITNSPKEIRDKLVVGNAINIPWPDDFFDLVISINTLHNLYNYDLHLALKELQRVGKSKYICVESYRNELEKANLLYWQVTCETFNTPDEWRWCFSQAGYNGDYSFIYFE